jgi:phosphatidylserine/phosphatidylglycerophosphate/cardiolipin synthase-like enzyme
MRRLTICLAVSILCGAVNTTAAAQDQIFFPAVDNVTAVLVERINAETVRIDMAAWYLTERAVSTALVNRFKAGVQVRLIGDRGSIFEIDPRTKSEFYWLASQGVPIRLRYHPTWYPEILHWKATIFAGQNIVTFGSANYTPFELAPGSPTNYKDEVVLFTADLALVNAFRTQFDRIWNDTTREPHSRISGPPYLRNWDEACASEAQCADYRTLYPKPAPMAIDTARLEPDYPLPPEMDWGQGAVFNSRIAAEITKEPAFVDFVIYRLTVDEITDALLAKHAAGVPVRLIIEPDEYRNRKWPEFWLTRAQIDRLWAAGVAIKRRTHIGLTHMKTLITSTTATVASSNFTAAWQRDHNYFVPAATKPGIHTALRHRFEIMWNDVAGFADFVPEPADAPALQAPANGQIAVDPAVTLVWNRAAFATRYDIYAGTTPTGLGHVASVDARLINEPPATYSWSPPATLATGTTYYWRIVSRTNAGLSTPSPIHSFTTGGPATVRVAPTLVDVGPHGGSGTLQITASTGLAWTANPSDPWVHVSPASGVGSGTIGFSITRNPTTTTRSATITIAGAQVTVTQEPNAVPGAPAGLTASVDKPVVRLAWQAPASGEVTRYLVEVAANPHFTGETLLQTRDAGTSVEVPGLSPGRYWVRVSATNDIGAGSASGVIEFTIPPDTPTAPGAPGGLSWSLVGARLSLTWQIGPGGPVASYVVEAGVGPGRTDLALPTGSASPTFAYDGVPHGVYFVRVRAVGSGGISAPSNEVVVFVGMAPPPAPPVNLHATVAGAQVMLTWAPGTLEMTGPPTYFILEAGSAPNAVNHGSQAIAATSVVVPGVPPGVYFVRVRAANATGFSAPSNEIVVTVP